MRSTVVRIASHVTTLAARLATKTHPTPNSEAKSPAAPNPKAKATFKATLSAFNPTKVMARPCSRNREKGMQAQTSKRMINPTQTTYSGCDTYASPMTRAMPLRKKAIARKKTAAASDVMPHVVAKSRRLAAFTSPPASSALAEKRK